MLNGFDLVKQSILKLICDLQNIERVHIWDLQEALYKFEDEYSYIVKQIGVLLEFDQDSHEYEYLEEAFETLTDELDCVRDIVEENSYDNHLMRSELYKIINVLKVAPQLYKDVDQPLQYALTYMCNSEYEWEDSTYQALKLAMDTYNSIENSALLTESPTYVKI